MKSFCKSLDDLGNGKIASVRKLISSLPISFFFYLSLDTELYFKPLIPFTKLLFNMIIPKLYPEFSHRYINFTTGTGGAYYIKADPKSNIECLKF